MMGGPCTCSQSIPVST